MQKSKEQQVHNVFEKISDNYDKMNSVISFQQHIRWRKDTMKRMNVQNGARHLMYVVELRIGRLHLAEAVGPNGEVMD